MMMMTMTMAMTMMMTMTMAMTMTIMMLVLTTSGEVYTWGDNDEGQLGDGSTNAIQKPRLVAALQGFCLFWLQSLSCHPTSSGADSMGHGGYVPPTFTSGWARGRAP